MLTIPTELADRAADMSKASQPMILAAVWPKKGAEDSLSTVSRMRGDGDMGALFDSNMVVQPETGELVLSAGAAVALDTASAGNPACISALWQADVVDVFRIDQQPSLLDKVGNALVGASRVIHNALGAGVTTVVNWVSSLF